MARQLGTLTIDLIAKIGGFTEGMTKAERVADQKSREMERKMKERSEAVEKAWTGIGAAISAGIAGITVGSVFSKVLTESRNAEQEQALLAAALKATGNQAGYSQDRLNDMASAMEGITTKSAGEFNQAQTVLLGFTNIVGGQLPQALKQAANFSVRTGADMKSAAETVGRALDIPSVGMASLARQGFKFSQSQIEAAEKLEQTGRIAEAQQVVLNALEETYGGAAEAARDTFGGAVDGLRNTLNGLMTGEGGSLDGAKKSLNDLTDTLGSNTTKAAFESIVGWVVSLTNMVIQATANIVAFINTADKLGALTGTDVFGKMKSEAEAAGAEVRRLGDQLERHQEALKRDPSNVILQRSVANTRKLVDAAMKRASGASDTLKDWANAAATAAKVDPLIAPDMTPRKPGAVNLKDGTPSKKSGGAKVDKDAKAADDFLKSLTEQVYKTQERTAYEKLFFDIQSKGLKLSESQLDKATGLATAIDMAKEAEASRAAEVAYSNDLYEAQNRLIAKEQQYQLEMLTYGMGDKAAAELRERISLMQQHQAELRKLQQDQALALAGTDSEKEQERIRAQYAMRLQIVETAQAQELQLYEDFLAQKRQKEGDWAAGAASALNTYLEQARDVYTQVGNITATALQGGEDALLSLLKTGQADVKGLLSSIGEGVVRMLIRMGMQMVANKLLGDTLQAAGIATAVAAGSATAAAWAPAAAMASLASFGANAAPAAAGITSTVALSQGMAVVGFWDGGYTGPGGKYQPAGIVHAGEGVLSQDDMRALGGPGAFEAFRRSLHSGYSAGGVVGAAVPPAVRRDYATELRGQAPIVNVIEDASKAGQVEQTQNADGSYSTSVFVRNIRNGSDEATVLETTYGLTRRGR